MTDIKTEINKLKQQYREEHNLHPHTYVDNETLIIWIYENKNRKRRQNVIYR